MKHVKGYEKVITFLTVAAMMAMMLVPTVSMADTATDNIKQNYKATDSLTDADKKNGAQNNYQKNTDATSGSYIYKTAEWTDKIAGKAKITLTTKQDNKESKKTRAVYALTGCTYHGFSKEIAKANIAYLLEHYDQLDVVICFNAPKIYEDVTLDQISTIINNSDFGAGRHHSCLVYQGLYDYLMGATIGAETGNEKQVKFPTCIYASFDAFLESSIENRYPEGYQYDCWDILKRYQNQGRYFSMGNSYGKKTNFLSMYAPTIAKEVMGCQNMIAGLCNPTLFPGIDSPTLWDGTTDITQNNFLDKDEVKEQYGETNSCFRTDVTTDFKYSETFKTLDVPIARNLQLTDEVSNEFSVTKVTANDDNVKVATVGNRVIATLENYTGTSPVTVTIDVQLKDTTDQTAWNKWIDTNIGNATTSTIVVDTGTSTEMTAPSTKLCYNKELEYNITTLVKGGKIDSSVAANKGDNKTINYKPNDGYKLKSVKVDGKAVDIKKYPDSYTFSDIAANHTIEVIYAKATAKYNIKTSVKNGKIDPSISANEGDDKTIKYKPNDGYKLKSIEVDGKAVSIKKYPDSYTFSDIAANHTIKVIYEKKADGATKTGDSGNMLMFIILMLTGLGVVAVSAKLKKE